MASIAVAQQIIHATEELHEYLQQNGHWNLGDTLQYQINKMHMAQEWAIKANKNKADIVVSEEYQCHWKVFSEEEAQHFPLERADNHAINLKPGAPETIDCKVYPLSV